MVYGDVIYIELGGIVQSLIKLTQEWREFWFQFCYFLVGFVLLYCLSFCFKFEQCQTTQNISSGKHFYTRKSNTSVNF